MDYTVHGLLQARILEWLGIPFSGDLPNPAVEPRYPTLQVDSSPAEPPGKPNSGLQLIVVHRNNRGFPGGSVVKNLPANVGDIGSIPGSGRSSGEGNSNPL